MEIITQQPAWAQWLLLAPLAAVLATAAITDWRHRKIYNWLTYPAFAGALILHTVVFGWSGLAAGFLTALVVLIIGLVILPFGWLGGGDIKLLVVIGAALGKGPLFEIFFYAVCVGFLMGVSLSLVNGYLWELCKRIGRYLKSLVLTVVTRTNLSEELETDERAYLPFAIPIFIGAAFAVTDVYLGWPLFLDWIRESMQSMSRF